MAVAAYCYLVPLLRAGSLAAPFLIFIALALFVPRNIFYAAYGVVTFGLIMGIKDLVIVNRRQAYELLVFLLSFAGFLLLYNHFAAWSAPAAFAAMAAAALLWLWLILSAPERPRTSGAPFALAALMLFELGAVIFFLPLSFFSQAALLFFGSALLYEASVNSAAQNIRQLLAWSGAYAAIAFALVLSAPWKI